MNVPASGSITTNLYFRPNKNVVVYWIRPRTIGGLGGLNLKSLGADYWTWSGTTFSSISGAPFIFYFSI
jgi:hypothetical protein